MKKLLLGLGTLSLAILPIAAMASCSAETTPTVKTEAAKLTKEVPSKIKDVTTTEVANEITAAADVAAKLTVVKKYADLLVVLADGFTFEVKSATIKPIEGSTIVQVNITVTETATPTNTADATLSITGLVEVPTVKTEAAKLTKEVPSKIKDVTTTEAANEITAAADVAAKLTAFEKYADLLVVLADGFTFEVKSAEVDASTKTILNVTIKVMESSKPANSKDTTVVITGFTA